LRASKNKLTRYSWPPKVNAQLEASKRTPQLVVSMQYRAVRKLRSQLSICFVKRNGTFELAAQIQDENFTGTKARTVPHNRLPDLSA
jgi:hypothetical protein